MEQTNEKTLGGFAKGDRVGTHPGTDAWMQGHRWGIVRKIGRKLVHVAMDTGVVLKLSPRNLINAE